MSLCNPVFARLSDGALNFHSKYAVTKKNNPVGFEILENDRKHKEERLKIENFQSQVCVCAAFTNLTCAKGRAEMGLKMAVKQTAGRDALGEFAPKFAQLNDDVLFGEV